VLPVRRLAAVIVLALGAFALGFAIAPSGDGPGSSRPAGAGPARTVAGVPVGYARSAAGAVRAAGEFVRAQGSPRWATPATRRAGLAAMATPTEAVRLDAIARRAPSQGPDSLTAALAAGRPAAYVNVPLAYALRSYRPDRARVSLWLLDVSATATAAPVEHYRTLELRLVWRHGDWRIAAMAGRPGPIPRGEGAYSTPGSFMRTLASMRWFDAPAP
jgi:hypothetical protein